MMEKINIDLDEVKIFNFNRGYNQARNEFENAINECSILINPIFNNKIQKGVFIEKKELKQKLKERNNDKKRI
jgi:hypothetical protein